VLVVRVLLVLSLSAVIAGGLLWVITKDRRYLRFVWLVLKYFLLLLAGVLAFYALERVILFL
jgi:hypothetical protein